MVRSPAALLSAGLRGLRVLARCLRDGRAVWKVSAIAALLVLANRAQAAEIYYSSQAEAYAACMAIPMGPTPHGFGHYHCQGPRGVSGSNDHYQTLSYEVWNNYWFPITAYCPEGTEPTTAGVCEDPNAISPEECAAKPDFHGGYQFPNGAWTCNPNGCASVVASLGDGGEVLHSSALLDGLGPSFQTCDWENIVCPTGYTIADDDNHLLGYCLPDDGDADNDGLLNLDDPTPTEAGEESVDTDGDGVPDSKDAFPMDPDNGKDKEEGETVNTSTGGGNCQTPPTSHGDAIAAQVAYQTWATRCAVDRLNATTKAGVNVTVTGGVSGGGDAAGSATTGGTNCETAYVCTAGDNVACETLKQAHKQRCNSDAAEGRVADMIANGQGEDMGNGGLTAADAFGEDGELGLADIDDSGFLDGARTCPGPPTVIASWVGSKWEPYFCDPMGVFAGFVLLGMYLHCAVILGRASSGT